MGNMSEKYMFKENVKKIILISNSMTMLEPEMGEEIETNKEDE